MKKSFLLAFSLLATLALSAQSLDSLEHYVGCYSLDLKNMIQLRDGSVLANCQLYSFDEENLAYVIDYGNRFLKINQGIPAVLDSAFIEDHDMNNYLVERNPFDNDNIYARAVRDLDNLKTDLCIQFFDDQLVFQEGKEVWVPLLNDTVFGSMADSYLLDSQGDIVLRLRVKTRREHHFFRIGIDGAVKAHSIYSYDDIPAGYRLADRDLVVFNEDPLEYAYYREGSHQVLQIAVLDSQLNLQEDLVPSTSGDNVDYQFGVADQVRRLDNASFLVASQYHSKGNPSIKTGVRVTKYENSTCQPLKTAYFQSAFSTINGLLGQAYPIDIQVAKNGDVYFAYHSDFDAMLGQVVVVRMDHDLNVIWQRYCLDEGYLRLGSVLKILEDETIAVGGVVFGLSHNNIIVRPPNYYFLFLNNNGVSLEESADILRPYAFYPNPVNDMLNIHYSPDAMPKKVEVFDLQGKKVVSQRNNLESIRTAELPSGVYSIRVTLEGGQSYTDKIVKQ